MDLFGNNSVHALQHELNKLSRILGKEGIKTEFHGTQAATDGRSKVYLPSMPADRQLTAEQQGVMRGFHIHEVSHIQHTRFRLWREKLSDPNQPPMLKDMWNAIEDVMIESKAIKKYAGAKRNLEYTIERVFREALIDADENRQSDDYHWAMEVPFAMCAAGRIDNGYASPALHDFYDGLPDEVTSFVNQYRRELKSCKSTQATYDLSVMLLERLAAEIKKDLEQQQQQQPSDDGDQSDSGDDAQSDGGSDSGDSSDSGDGSDKPEGNDAGSDSSSSQPGDGEDDAGGEANGKKSNDDGEQKESEVSTVSAGGGLPDRSTFKDVNTAIHQVVDESGGIDEAYEWWAVQAYESCGKFRTITDILEG
jgi:hypothetical protein